MLARKVCATRNIRNKLDRYRHFVPGFNKYTESNCKYAFRQKRVTQTVNCFLTTLPYEGIYISSTFGFIITHDNDQQSIFRRSATMSSATIIGFRPADEILVS